jgi:hypothetical protein
MVARTTVPPALAEIAPDGLLTARQRRHFMLQRLVQRCSSGSGSDLASLRGRTAMQPWPDLRQLLDGIPWAIVGGVATRAYMPERMTNDLDILVRRVDGPQVVERLLAAGYVVLSELAIPGQALRAPGGTEVDVLFGAEPWLNEALANSGRDAAGFPVIGLPYLVLLKLKSARAQDWADVARMLGQAEIGELDAVRAVVGRFSPEDAEDLESLIFLGQQEMRESGES